MARRPFVTFGAYQVVDAQGNALAGRSVTFWSAQTGGTQYTDLQDASGSALPGGVATTDSYGYFSIQGPNDNTAKMWADAGAERTLVYSTDTPDRISSVESTVTANTSSITAINTAKGAASGFASLDATGRLPQSQLTAGTFRTSWFSVLDYGAKGDGVTDDTSAIQSAITAAGAVASMSSLGGYVYFPAATYLISSALSIPNNVTMSGSGMSNTIILTASGAAISAMTGNQPSPSNIILEKMGIQSQASSGTAAGLNFNNTGSNIVSNVVIRDVAVKGFRGDQIYFRNPQNVVLSNVQVTGATGSGWGINMDGVNGSGPSSLYSCISTLNTTGSYRFYGQQSGIAETCQAQNSPIGFLVDTCKVMSLESCSSNSCTTNGLKMNAGNGTSVQSYVSFGDCSSGGDIFYLTGSSVAVTINSILQGSVVGTPTSFIRTDSGCQVLMQQCSGTTANNIAANTQVTAGVTARHADQTGSSLTLTTSEQDVAGATLTFSTVGTNTVCIVTGIFDMSNGATSTGANIGYINVDGTTQTSQSAVFSGGSSTAARGDAQVTLVITLAAAGSHTIKLRAKASSGTGTYAVNPQTASGYGGSSITVAQLTA